MSQTTSDFLLHRLLLLGALALGRLSQEFGRQPAL